MKNKRYIYGLLSGIGAEVLFGFSFLFSKDTLNKVPALSLLSWRFILAFIVMTICCRTGLIKVNFRGKSLRPLFRLALFHPILYFIGETIGVKLTTASESGTIIAIIPIATLILSALILKEKPGKFQVAGIIITFIGGFVIVLLQGVNLSLNIVGYIMLFIAVFAYSLFSIFNNRETSYTNEEKTYVMLFSAMTFFTIAAGIDNLIRGTISDYFSLPFENRDFLVAILYLGIASSVIAFWLNNISITTISSNANSSLAGITTVVTVSSSVLILHETFTSWQFIGMVLILCGVYIANFEKIRDEFKPAIIETRPLINEKGKISGH